MSIRLALADSNKRYIEKLAAWIQKHMPYRFSAEVLTSSGSFRAWAENGGKADLIVISIDMAKEVQSCLPRDGVLVLDDGSHERLNLEFPRADKYRPAEELAKDILSLCADRMPGIYAREKRKQNVTLVIGLDGADAAFPVAPAMARVLSARDRKTMYLSLEIAQSTGLYFSGSSSKGLNEMLYYVKSNRDNLYMRLETCIARDFSSGVHFLSAPGGLLPPGAVDPSDIERLLFAMDSEGDFDEIVVAVDLGMFHLVPVLLARASRAFAVGFNTEPSMARMERLLRELEKGDGIAGIKEKLVLILVNISPAEGLGGLFDDIRKFTLEPDPMSQSASGWVPSDKGLSALASILDSFEKAGWRHEQIADG